MKVRAYRMAFVAASLLVFAQTVGAPRKWH